MKKGLILALLVVAMVALVLPVSARAPIIKALPTIIIGDNEGATGTPPKGILRFPGALDLKSQSVVDWNNDESYTSDTFHAYLYPADATPATDVKPYGFGRVIGTLTTNEYTNLLGAGTMPAPDTRITSYTSPSSQNWLVNLYDEGRHVLTDPATADVGAQGVAQDTYSEEVAMKLVCGVTSGTTLVASEGSLAVKCQSSTSDGIESTFTEVVSYSFTGSDDGWTFSTYAGFTAATPTTSGPGSTGIGFVVSTAVVLSDQTRCMYSIWMSPAIIPSSSTETGKVFRATATLESTSTSPDTALGYRLRYFSTGFAHQGFMIVETKTGFLANDVANVPYAGHPFTAKLFWAPRPDLGDMGDTEGQALITGDYRKYKLAWEIIGWTGEQGTLTMESIFVDSFAKPAATTKVVAWGSGAGEIPFNSDAAGGMQTRDQVAGFTDGSIAATTANAVVTLTGAEKTSRYVGIKPYFAVPLINLQPVSNHLYRFSATLACGSRTAVPTYRVVINSQMVPPLPAVQLGAARNIGWIDWFSFCSVAGAGGKQTSFMLPGQTVAPFAPATGTGSSIDVYVYSHSIAPSTSGTSIFIPILNSVDTGVYGTGTAWPDPVTAMTWSAAGWEDLGADY